MNQTQRETRKQPPTQEHNDSYKNQLERREGLRERRKRIEKTRQEQTKHMIWQMLDHVWLRPHFLTKSQVTSATNQKRLSISKLELIQDYEMKVQVL
jgi:ABC-type transport system involved in cytochrome c biogenesis ATPase subunit